LPYLDILICNFKTKRHQRTYMHKLRDFTKATDYTQHTFMWTTCHFTKFEA